MCNITVPGSCKPQHDISSPFGNLYAEALPIPVKEMTLGMSLAPGPAACQEQLQDCSISLALLGIAWQSFSWHRVKVYKGPFHQL